MINSHYLFPLIGIDGETLKYTKKKWKYGNVWVEYSRNNEGYRSEDFKQNPKFLFAGCSETFGEAADVETTWAYKLFNKIKNDKDSYCNLGLGGLDASLIIYQVMMFIEKYGKPENLFIVFPELNRCIETDSKKTATVSLFEIVPGILEEYDNILHSSSKIVNMVRSVNLLQIKNFEMYCKNIGINLIWSNWSNESEEKILEEGFFNNYVSIINEKDIADKAIELGYNYKTLELTRPDGNHHGEIFHDYWANIFYNKYKDSIK
jgi:hypothetical protein